MIVLYFFRLLNTLHMNSRQYLKCGLEIRHCLPLQNSVICLFFSFVPYSVPSGTLKSTKELVIIQGKKGKHEVIHHTESRKQKFK